MQRVAPSPIEQDFVTWATTALPGVHVSTRVPTSLPAQFVRVLRGTGARRNLAQSAPSLVVECWGSTDAQAWSLASRVWALLSAPDLDRIGSTWLSDAECTEPVNFPDVASGRPRYVFTFYPLTILEEPTP